MVKATASRMLVAPAAEGYNDHHCRGEIHEPFRGEVFFRQGFSVEVYHLAVSPQVQLNNDEVFGQDFNYLGTLEVYCVQFAAIGATALFEQNYQAFTLGGGLFQIGAHFQKTVEEEVLLVQSIIAHARLCAGLLCQR